MIVRIFSPMSLKFRAILGRFKVTSVRHQPGAARASYNRDSHLITLMASSVELVQIDLAPRRPQKKPEWLKARAPMGENYHDLKRLARTLDLHTVCESAQCPNIGECWNHKTATFMLLGNLCTRRCGFCAVPKGKPEPLDWDEPRRVAEAVATLGLKHAVVTSVNRDDDNMGGAKIFAETIRQVREQAPGCQIEVLIPDFQGREDCLKVVIDAKPEVLNHNTETVPRLYRAVRSGARYERTLDLLSNVKRFAPTMVSKDRCDGGHWRDHGRAAGSFPRPSCAQSRYPYRGPISAAFKRPSPHDALLHA